MTFSSFSYSTPEGLPLRQVPSNDRKLQSCSNSTWPLEPPSMMGLLDRYKEVNAYIGPSSGILKSTVLGSLNLEQMIRICSIH